MKIFITGFIVTMIIVYIREGVIKMKIRKELKELEHGIALVKERIKKLIKEDKNQLNYIMTKEEAKDRLILALYQGQDTEDFTREELDTLLGAVERLEARKRLRDSL